MNLTLVHVLVLSSMLFAIGLYGALSQREAIRVLMCIELMLNSVNLNLVGFSRLGPMANVSGQLFAIFVMAVAAAEAAVGLAIVLQLARMKGSISVDKVNSMRG